MGLCAKQSRHAHVIAGTHVCLYNSRLGLILCYMSSSDVVIERLNKYSRADAVGIGRLMPYLNDKLSGDPMAEELLSTIISSSYHDQIVARMGGKIVGTATVNLLLGPGVRGEGYLEDFVVDPEVRGRGIGDKLWQAIIIWCREKGVDLGFTSNPARVAAHRFYNSHGAEVRDTTVFHVSVDRMASTDLTQ